ncbi:MAG TPA: O-antigen ligase family protein [Candidatus Dormibacteraeota bacterium]|nr:O-antigen ligase family protein [Candidatus Dormibacteraeota bacterium]
MRAVLGRLGVYLPAAVALALATLFIPTAEDSFILPRASTVIAGACLGVGLALLAPGGPGLGRLRWPLIGAAGAATLAFVFSISWPLSFAGSYTRYESLPIRLAYFGLFAVAVWLLRESRPRDWVVRAFVFGTAVACLEAMAQWAGHVPYRPDGNLGNANLLAALIAMAFPLALARGWRGGRFMVAWWLGVAVMAGGLVATTSRSGGLGALAGCLALLVFSLRGKVAAAAAVVSTAALATALVLIVLSPLRFLNDDPGQLRIHLWRDGLHMILARPLTGWGEDTTGLAFGHFLSGDWSPGVTFDRLHSGPLDIAATQGLLGLAAGGWLLVILFRGTWRSRFSGDVGALAAACVGYSVWVLFNFDWAPATGAFWLLAGTAWAGVRAAQVEQDSSATSLSSSANGPGVWRSSAAVAMILVAVALGVLPVMADVWYLQGRGELSVRVDPLQARYHWALGQALVAQGSVARGVDEMRIAADLGETEPGLYVELGDREAQLGRQAESRKEYRRALQIDPFYAPATQRLAATGG